MDRLEPDTLGWHLHPPPEAGRPDEYGRSAFISRQYVLTGSEKLLAHLSPNFILSKRNIPPLTCSDDDWFTACKEGVLAGTLLAELQGVQLLAELGLRTIGRLVAARKAHGALARTSLNSIIGAGGYSMPKRATVNTWPTVNGLCDPVNLAYSILNGGFNGWKAAQIMRHVHFNSDITPMWLLTLCAIGESWARRSYIPLDEPTDALPPLPLFDKQGRSIVTHEATMVPEICLFPVAMVVPQNLSGPDGPITAVVYSDADHNTLIASLNNESLPVHASRAITSTDQNNLVAGRKVS